MAKISNTTSYPLVTPSIKDYVIGTSPNATPANQTSNFLLGDIKNLVAQDLQSVLDKGNQASNSIKLTNPNGGDALLLESGIIRSNFGDLVISTASAAGNLTASTQSILSLLSDKDIRLNSSLETTIESEGTLTMTSGDTSAGEVRIGTGGPNPGDATQLILEGGIIKAVNIIDLASDEGVVLNGVSGAAGQYIISQGPGLPLTWGAAQIPLTNKFVFAGDANDEPIATDLIQLDVPQKIITVGNPTSTTINLDGKTIGSITHTSSGTSLALGLDSFADALLQGSKNTAYGIESGALLTDISIGNTFVGYQAGSNITLGSSNTCIGNESNSIGANTERATALGEKSEAASGGLALGYSSSAEESCIAIGENSDANVKDGTPMINFSPELINGLLNNNIIYSNNADAVQDGLNAGDVYLLDNNVIGIPTAGANGGPAIVCVAYLL